MVVGSLKVDAVTIVDVMHELGRLKVDFARLPSLQGHDSFLVDMDRFRPLIGDFLKLL